MYSCPLYNIRSFYSSSVLFFSSLRCEQRAQALEAANDGYTCRQIAITFGDIFLPHSSSMLKKREKVRWLCQMTRSACRRTRVSDNTTISSKYPWENAMRPRPPGVVENVAPTSSWKVEHLISLRFLGNGGLKIVFPFLLNLK